VTGVQTCALPISGQSVMMVLGAVLAVAAHLGWATPWVIIAISFAEGAAWASVTPSWQAVVPALVPRSELPSAIALNSAQFNTARLLGPMIAGALLSAAGAAFVFDLNVVSFVGIVAVLARSEERRVGKGGWGRGRRVPDWDGGLGGRGLRSV